MNKNRKKHKGMTLYEMIISIAIFALMAGVLVGVGAHIDSQTRATNGLKNKIVRETPFAANRITQDNLGNDLFYTEEIDMDIKYSGHVSYVGEDPSNPGSYITIDKDNPSITVKGDKFKTEAAITGDKDTTLDPEAINGKLNLEFIRIQPTSTSTASSAPST